MFSAGLRSHPKTLGSDAGTPDASLRDSPFPRTPGVSRASARSLSHSCASRSARLPADSPACGASGARPSSAGRARAVAQPRPLTLVTEEAPQFGEDQPHHEHLGRPRGPSAAGAAARGPSAARAGRTTGKRLGRRRRGTGWPRSVDRPLGCRPKAPSRVPSAESFVSSPSEPNADPYFPRSEPTYPPNPPPDPDPASAPPPHPSPEGRHLT